MDLRKHFRKMLGFQMCEPHPECGKRNSPILIKVKYLYPHIGPLLVPSTWLHFFLSKIPYKNHFDVKYTKTTFNIIVMCVLGSK